MSFTLNSCKSEEPKTSWELDDYVEMIHSLLQELKVKDINLIGHSFGGKISIIYASKYPVKRLVLKVMIMSAVHSTVKIKRRYLLGKANSSPLGLTMGLIIYPLQFHMQEPYTGPL